MAIEPRIRRRAVTRRSRQPRIKPNFSPYVGIDQEAWAERTRDLIDAHPADLDELVSVVLKSWGSILESTLGSGFKIGTDIFPRPQILGFLLHELIPLEFERLRPGVWQRDADAGDKDPVYVDDDYVDDDYVDDDYVDDDYVDDDYVDDDTMSIEIKTSSNRSQNLADRSYGQPATLRAGRTSPVTTWLSTSNARRIRAGFLESVSSGSVGSITLTGTPKSRHQASRRRCRLPGIMCACCLSVNAGQGGRGDR
ncbi:MAG: ScaI family restriction endonuclease [Acidimicrobiia bacterium]|nr:ScaI family restriction endonuclease [Acidimicrobiia bacterium]